MSRIDARLKPTLEQMHRAKIADRCFELHNQLNIEISKAVELIMNGGVILDTLGRMQSRIQRALLQMACDAERIMQEDRQAEGNIVTSKRGMDWLTGVTNAIRDILNLRFPS